MFVRVQLWVKSLLTRFKLMTLVYPGLFRPMCVPSVAFTGHLTALR